MPPLCGRAIDGHAADYRSGRGAGRQEAVGMKRLWKKYREFILYCVFGGLTFLVDTGVFFIFGTMLDLDSNPWLMHACSICSTLAAITFAYVTNRKYVFESTVTGVRAICREMGSFYAARIFTMVMAEILMQITVVHMGFEARLMKLLVNIIVIALNYLFSKLWIFNKKENPKQ